MGWTGVGMEMVWSGEGTEMEYGKSWDGGGMGEERSRDGGWGKREGWRVGWSMGWSRKGAEMEMGWKWDGGGDGGAVQRPCADPIAAITPTWRPSPAPHTAPHAAPHTAPHAAPQRRGVDKAALGVTACKYCSPAKHSAGTA